MAHERKCMMCGEQYSYCSHCNSFDPKETWKYLYHDKTCMEISNIWYAYRGKEISKEEAREKMSALKPNIDNVLKYTSIAAREIREIFDVPEKNEVAEETKVEPEVEQVVEEVKTEPVVDENKNVESVHHVTKTFNNNRDFRNKKK